MRGEAIAQTKKICAFRAIIQSHRSTLLTDALSPTGTNNRRASLCTNTAGSHYRAIAFQPSETSPNSVNRIARYINTMALSAILVSRGLICAESPNDCGQCERHPVPAQEIRLRCASPEAVYTYSKLAKAMASRGCAPHRHFYAPARIQLW
jgi:hypothetical protein